MHLQKNAYNESKVIKSMISTLHRRNIREKFETNTSITFTELKGIFVSTKEMNQTTLYRILEAFLREGILHEITLGNERIFTLCKHHEKEESGIKLTYCTKCSHIEETHFPLSEDAIKSESIEFLKCCTDCNKKI